MNFIKTNCKKIYFMIVSQAMQHRQSPYIIGVQAHICFIDNLFRYPCNDRYQTCFAFCFALTVSHRKCCMVFSRYGEWKSPITTKMLVAGSVRLGGIALDGERAYWLEGRPSAPSSRSAR